MKETKKNGAAQSKAGKRDYSAFKNMYRKIPQDLRDVIVYYIGDRPLVIHEGVNEVTGEVVTAEFIRQWHMDRDREVYNNNKHLCKMIAGKKVQLKKLKEQLLSAPTLTPVEAYYAMNSGCSGEGERVQSSHISDPTAKAAIGALDYIIRTWRDDYKKSLKKYGTLAGDIYLLEMAADYVGGEQGTVVRQIYVDGVFWKDAVGLEGKSLSWQVIRKMERQAQEEMAEFILKYWKTQREENEEDMKDGTEKVV